MSNKLYVIGIGYKPLDTKARDIILGAGVILASTRLFEVFKGYDEFESVRDRIKVINNIDETIAFIRAEEQKSRSTEVRKTSELLNLRTIVLLASGDPMFFGIGRRAVREFGKDKVEIIPDLSSIQLAFSRIKEPWDDAFLMSLHGGPDPEKRRRLPYEIKDIPALIQRHDRIAILTDRENNPAEIARVLNQSPVVRNYHLTIFVCEKLGYPDERIISGAPEELVDMKFADPNVVVIKKTEDRTEKMAMFGLKEGEIVHSKGLITKDEIRAVVIHKLRPFRDCVFWDIGAGSGSVSLEMAMLSDRIKVFAVESDPEQIGHLKANRERYGVYFEIIEGEAPYCLSNLPPPDRVFIGGSGGRLKEIMEFVDRTLTSGIVVVNAVTIETLNTALNFFEERHYSVDVVQVNVSRLKKLGEKRYFSSENPLFMITATK